MLLPKRTKRRKVHRGRMKGRAMRGNTVSYGDFGLQTLEPCWITSNQIEAARVAMTRFCKRAGKVWIKIFPDKPVSKKPAETRMGKGKGAPEFWVAVVKPGRVMFEIGDVSEDMTNEELENKLKDLKSELFNLRFQLAVNQLENPMRIKEVKKSIARVLTVLREKKVNA